MSEKYDPNNWLVKEGDDHFWIMGGQCGVVCETVTMTPSDRENIHLFTASRELLAACEAFVRWYESDSSEFNRDGAFERAKAAIAKAKGETNK